jgi:hypothetical protein
MTLLPEREVPFAALGRRWVAWVAADPDEGCRDVLVYEVRGGGFRLEAFCVLGARLAPVGKADKVLVRAAARALGAR